jgi:hypothetical protein
LEADGKDYLLRKSPNPTPIQTLLGPILGPIEPDPVVFGPPLSCCTPLESILGQDIRYRNQLAVEVLECKELRPIVMGKTENVFCEISIKSEDHKMFPMTLKKSNNQDPQSQHTYVCHETLDPSFLGQKFLFSVNERAAIEPRRYRIRVTVKTSENLRVNRFLGMADIHLTCLKNEQVCFTIVIIIIITIIITS